MSASTTPSHEARPQGNAVGATSDAAALLRSHGLRVTRPRRLVLEALRLARRPLRAEEIAAGLERAAEACDLATVYRSLETLERVGLARHVHFGHGAGLYELVRDEAGAYAVCDGCGLVRTVPAAALLDIRAALDAVVEIRPSFTHFPLVGLCRGCRRVATTELRPPTERRRDAHS